MWWIFSGPDMSAKNSHICVPNASIHPLVASGASEGARCLSLELPAEHVTSLQITSEAGTSAPDRLLAIPSLSLHLAMSEASKDSEIGQFNFHRCLPALDHRHHPA